MKFNKYKLGVTALHTPTKIFYQQEEGKVVQITIKDLIDAGVPESEIARHIELGTIVGLEGAEIAEVPAKTDDAKK